MKVKLSWQEKEFFSEGFASQVIWHNVGNCIQQYDPGFVEKLWKDEDNFKLSSALSKLLDT